MKRWLTKMAILAALGGACLQGTAPAQAPPNLGPGDQGATLKQPGLEPSTKAPAPYPFDYSLHSTTTSPGFSNSLTPAYPYASAPAQPNPTAPKFNQIDINRDIEVTKETGPWLVHVMTYTGEKAPQQARDFVKMLREEYKYNAHIFNYGAKEKAEEYKRAWQEVETQREALRKSGLTADVPLRIRVSHIPENTTVFIGGFMSREEAERVLKGKIRELTPPDPTKVDLQTMYIGNDVLEERRQATGRADLVSTGKIYVGNANAYKNPFKTAFIVRNPALPSEGAPSTQEDDLRLLRKINASEPFSLFDCKKRYTLVIKQYSTPVMMQESQNQAKGFLDKFIPKKGDWIDIAANNAHNIAEAFRKSGMTETYVLHARYCSYVTVGGFDSPTDPNLESMQRFLEGQFRMDVWRPFELMPRPMPMEVPR